MATDSTPKAVGTTSTEKRFFSLEEANKTLSYVQGIVKDICETYKQAVAAQQRMQAPMPSDESDTVRAEYEEAVERLSRYVDELEEVGVELKDYQIGLIDFPTRHDGREVCLCWKLGEEKIESWHELDAGFAGRQSVETLGK